MINRPQVVAIIPVRARDLVKSGGMPMLGGRPLISYTIEMAKRAKTIHRVIVSTDSESIRQLAIELGAEAPFVRPPELAAAGVGLEQVLQHGLTWLESHEEYRPDIVVRLEISHPFREDGLIDRVVDTLCEGELDTVFTAYEERHNFWRINPQGELEAVTDEHHTRTGRAPLYKEIGGLVCATTAETVRIGERLGRRVGVVPLASWQALVDTQDEVGLDLARRLL